MAWYGLPSDENYWYAYWKKRLNSNYYASAEARLLTNDELGNVLLKEMRPDGVHLEAGCGAGYWIVALRHQGLMVEGIGGPVFKAIEAWNPEWADKLRAVDPGLLLQFLESPWFVANIKPRIQPYMDKFLGSKAAGASDVNPFLKELGQ